MGSTVNGTQSSESSGKASSTGKNDRTKLTASDFLKLFVTQLQNQDFNDPMDNTAMMNQITQLSNMQMMQEMASYSKSGYAMSLVGKTVTASRITNGELDTTTGTVSKVSLVDDEYVLYVGGKKYTLEQIMQITDPSSSSKMDVSKYSVKATSVTSNSATVKWSVPTEDATVASGLKYTVYYSKNGPMKTAAEVQNGTKFGTGNQQDMLGADITGLEAGQTYYINVLVQDADGNKYVYSPATIVTNK